MSHPERSMCETFLTVTVIISLYVTLNLAVIYKNNKLIMNWSHVPKHSNLFVLKSIFCKYLFIMFYTQAWHTVSCELRKLRAYILLLYWSILLKNSYRLSFYLKPKEPNWTLYQSASLIDCTQALHLKHETLKLLLT